MKAKIIAVIIGALLLMPVLIQAQATPLTKVFDRFQDKPGFEAKEINESTLSEGENEGLEGKDIKELFAHFEAMRILSYHGSDTEGKGYAEQFRQKIDKALAKGSYVDAVSVVDGKEKVRVYFYEPEPGKIREIALFIQDKDEISLISVTGELEKTSFLEILDLVGNDHGSKDCKHEDDDQHHHDKDHDADD